MDAREPRWGRLAASAALSVLLSVWANAAGAAERVALVIGNGDYKNVSPLANPRNDAEAVGDAFERLGYTVTRLMNADYDELRKGLSRFKQAARGKEVAVVFYAGHGIGVAGSNFLVPVDAELGYADAVEDEAIPLDRLMSAVGNTRHLGLVILDACRNNPFVAKMKGETRSIERGLARLEDTTGKTMVAYAAKHGKTADDGSGAHSPYTEALLRYLKEPGLEVRKLFGKVRDAVVDTTKRRGRVQEPWTYESLGGRDFYLASAAAPPPKGTVTSTAGGTPPPSGDAARAYEAAERLNTVAGYRAFIRRFPESYEAELARGHIAKLEEEPLVVAGGDPEEEEVSPVVTPPPEEVERRLELRREDRRLVQMGLAAAGHDPGPADGMIGRGTREAIRRWQGARGEPATGYLDADGAKALLALGEREAKRRRAEAERERKAKEAERKAREAEERRLAEAERKRKAEEAAQRARAEAERKRKEREAEERRKRARKPGDTFRDCPECPEMVVVPEGRFRMGSPSSEAGRRDDGREGPVHLVTIGYRLAVGVNEVTRGEFARFVSATGRSMGNNCWTYEGGEWKERSGRHWRSPGFSQTDSHPVVCVDWNDAKAYVRWLSGKTGEEYRLPSEAEWEYVARAGTRTARYWGESERGQCRYANGADRTAKRRNSGWTTADCDDGYYQTAPVGTYEANGFGLNDVMGNVWEWTEDCWNGSYAGAPRDGSAWTSGDCGRRVLRGGSWLLNPGNLRSAFRSRITTGIRNNNLGFRVARTLTP